MLKRSSISVGLVGFGAFGRLIGKHIAPHVALCAYDPALLREGGIETGGVRLVRLEDAAQCAVVILAVPVSGLEATVRAISPHLKPGTLVIDVGSVKLVPVQIMLAELPAHVDIVASHPLFGPQSAAAGLKGLKIALCPIRGSRDDCVAAFLRSLGLEVLITSPDAHDREAAVVQGLTHLIAKVLEKMRPLPTHMTTRSFDLLMQAVEMVRHDAPEVFQAIEQTNPHSQAVRRRFFDLAAKIDAELSTEQ